jgi:hypothetical protein
MNTPRASLKLTATDYSFWLASGFLAGMAVVAIYSVMSLRPRFIATNSAETGQTNREKKSKTTVTLDSFSPSFRR